MKTLRLTALAFFLLSLFLAPLYVAFGNETGFVPVRIAILGDSLTAGFGLPQEEGFPARLQAALRRDGFGVAVVNAGVSGDTTAGGLARVDWLLASDPDLVIVELGGNDALRGLSPEETRSNLDAILNRLDESGVAVLLAGMRAPRNLGRPYYTKFDRIYPEVAEKYGVAFYPFFLEGVAGDPELNFDDGIHPNGRGVEVIVDRILPVVKRILRALPEERRKGDDAGRAEPEKSG